MMTSRSSFINFDNFHDTDIVKQRAMNSAVDGGPNSGFEIEGVDFFKGEEVAGEFPEMRDDIDLIISTEAYVRRLVDFRHRVIAAKGMSRGMAYELCELGASNESYGNPNQFTEAVSAIGMEPSLEAIDIKLWAIIAAAIAFVIGLIYKFINWMFGDNTSSGGNPSAQMDKVADGIKETNKHFAAQKPILNNVLRSMRKIPSQKVTVDVPMVQDLTSVKHSHMTPSIREDIVTHAVDLTNSGARPNSSDEKLSVSFSLKEALFSFQEGYGAYEYIHNPSKYARFIYSSHSEAMDLLVASFDGFYNVAQILVAQLSMVEEIVENLTDWDNKASALKANSGLQTIRTMTLDKEILKFGKFSFDTTEQWRLELSEQLDAHDAKRDTFGDLEDMLSAYLNAHDRLLHVNFNNLATFFELLSRGIKPLSTLQRIAQEQSVRQQMTDDPATKAQADMVVSVSRSLLANLSGALGVYSIISKIYREVSIDGLKILEAIRKNSSHLIKFYRRYEEDIPPTLSELYDDLQSSLKGFGQHIPKPHMAPGIAVPISIGHVTISGGDLENGDRDPERSITVSTAGAQQITDLIRSAKPK